MTCKEVIKYVIQKHLSLSDDFLKDYSTVVIDINSIVSVMFRFKEEINDKDVADEVSELIELFISRCIALGLNLDIMYTTKNSSYHTNICPTWCEERYNRVDITTCTFLKAIITTLNKMSNTSKRIKLLNTNEYHPVMFVADKKTTGRILIMSKDPVFESIEFLNATLVYGNTMIDLDDANRYKNLGINISVDEFKFFKAFTGDERNDFKGKPGYGIIRSLEYIRNNNRSIKFIYANPENIKIDLKFRDNIKYAALYDIKKMLAYKYGKS